MSGKKCGSCGEDTVSSNRIGICDDCMPPTAFELALREAKAEITRLTTEVKRLSKALFDLSPDNNPAMQGSAVDSAIAWIVDLKAEVARLRAALKVISIGDYDNAHDCKAAAKVAHAALESQ